MSEQEPRPCRPCEIAWGMIGLGAAVVIALLAADLISGGALARLVTGTVAEVIPIKGEQHDSTG